MRADPAAAVIFSMWMRPSWTDATVIGDLDDLVRCGLPTALIPFLAFECLALRPADFVDRNDRQNCKGRESNCHLGAPVQPSRALYSRGECFPRLNTSHWSRSLSSDWPKPRAGWFRSLTAPASRSWHRPCSLLCMPLFYFKPVDSRIVSDHGVHQLADEAAARKAAIELARSIRGTRPDLVGQSCSVSVTDEHGAGICGAGGRQLASLRPR